MSSSSPVLVNTDGLFNSVRWAALMSAGTLAHLRAALAHLEAKDAESATPIKPAQAKLRTQQREVLALLDELPSGPRKDPPRCAHLTIAPALSVSNAPNERFVRIPVPAGNFLTSLSPHLVIEEMWPEDPADWGVVQVRGLMERQKAFKALADLAWERIAPTDRPQGEQYHRYAKMWTLTPTATPHAYVASPLPGAPTGGVSWPVSRRNDPQTVSVAPPEPVDFHALKTAHRLAKLLSDGKASVRSDDAVDNLSQAHAFAIYSGYGNQNAGYLDGRGHFVDGVGGARLFESAKAAQTTIRSRGLGDAAVVALDVQVTGLAPGYTSGQFEKLGAVVADLNRRKLMDMVGRARGHDLAELKAKVAQREAELAVESSSEPEPKRESESARRM